MGRREPPASDDVAYTKLVVDEEGRGRGGAVAAAPEGGPAARLPQTGQLAQWRVAEVGYRLPEILKQVAE
jgi:hypothetical protein